MAKKETQNKTVKKTVITKEKPEKEIKKVTSAAKATKKSAESPKEKKEKVTKKAAVAKVSKKSVLSIKESKKTEPATKVVAIKKPATKKAAPKKVSVDIVDVITKAMVDKKAFKVVSIDLRKIESASTDFFIICHGSSTTHVDAIASSVEDEVQKQINEKPFHTEGYQNSEWVLVDYFNVVVHVFLEEKRDFYRLEKLWADGEIKAIN